MKRIKGFTLVELLVVVAIMAILGLIFTNTIVQTLRGQNKIKIIGAVKQNGQVVLDRISNEIRQAEKVFCVNGDGQANWDTIILFKQGVYTRIRFYSPTVSNNGRFTIYYPPVNPTTGISPGCDEPMAVNSEQNLSDTDTLNGVSLDFDPLTLTSPVRPPIEGTDRIFTINRQPGYADNVTIKFRAMPGVLSGGTYENMVSEGGVFFTTSAQVRGGKI